LLKLRQGTGTEPERDTLQVPEDSLWLSTLVTSRSRIDAKGEVGKLRTARGKKTNQILGPRHAKVLLASREMTPEDNNLAMALSSGSKDMDDRI